MIVAARAGEPGHPWLSAAETHRLRGMRPARAAEFTTGRVLARALVASATGRAPTDIEIRVRPAGDDRAGQPWLVDADGAVSIAHSGGVVIVAYRREGAVGVDIEGGVDAAGDAVSAYLPAAERPHRGWDPATLAAAWVRREAVVKCLGVGLAAPPDAVVLTRADASPAVVACAYAPPERITVVDLDVGGLPGALAVAVGKSSPRLDVPTVGEVVDAGDLVRGMENVAVRFFASVGV